ncbi:MAG: ATP-binding protein [Oscillospiraceae bacterium]
MQQAELLKAYLNDANSLINEYDQLLKKRNSIGSIDTQSVDALFRIMHTIKASSSILKIERIVAVSQDVENILAYLKKYGNGCLPHAKVLDLLFKTEYFLRSQLRNVKFQISDDTDRSFEKELTLFMRNIPVDSVQAPYDPNKTVYIKKLFDIAEATIKEMSTKLNKKVVFASSGENLMATRKILDGLTVPVLHLVRNAMDHGIENPQERLSKGKPESGVITLTAGCEEDVFFVTVSNDGRRIDCENILDRAEAKNILKKPREEYSSEDAANFILMRGFSTKDEVTEYSGRGIGMDIVKSSVEKLGGAILISGVDSEGLSITLAIPNTGEEIKYSK